MLALPRSLRLAAWASAWLGGAASLDDVVSRVRGSDEPHDVRGMPGEPVVSLADALLALRGAGARAFRVALPRAGDPHGLAGPPDLTAAAVDAGEAVVAAGANHALVPHVATFGPPGDQGHQVSWTWHDAAEVPPGPGPAEAEKELSLALLETGSVIDDLDVAAWRPEVEQLLDDLRSAKAAAPLPHAFPARAQALAAQAARILAIVDLALADDGGALTAASVQARRDGLRPLERAARHALAAAANSLADAPR